MATQNVRAVNILDGDVVVIDGRAVQIIQAKHRWRYGVQYCKLTYVNADGHTVTIEAEPETRYPVISLARH